MHIERMHKMIECLTESALCELEKGVDNVCTEEMGEVIDMIKDLTEAECRAVIVKSMKKADEEEEERDKELLRVLKEEYGEEGGRRHYDEWRYKDGRFAPKGRGTRRGYDEPPYHRMDETIRDMDREQYGRMNFAEPMSRESNYDRAKRSYTETKSMHKAGTAEDKQKNMESLDGYMKELTGDVTRLMHDMTDEEKSLLRNKLSTLVSKIQ